jgi:hypothetical protein
LSSANGGSSADERAQRRNPVGVGLEAVKPFWHTDARERHITTTSRTKHRRPHSGMQVRNAGSRDDLQGIPGTHATTGHHLDPPGRPGNQVLDHRSTIQR